VLLLLLLLWGLQQLRLLLVRLHCRQQELQRQRLQHTQARQAARQCMSAPINQ
jgi:hypothetical protein